MPTHACLLHPQGALRTCFRGGVEGVLASASDPVHEIGEARTLQDTFILVVVPTEDSMRAPGLKWPVSRAGTCAAGKLVSN